MKINLMKIASICIAVLFLSCCSNKVDGDRAQIGPITGSVKLSDYSAVYYVSLNGSDGNDGSKTAPWRSIHRALISISSNSAVLVGAGNYTEGTIALVADVDLYGGYAQDWTRDIAANRTVLDGKGRERIMIGANNSKVDGFVIANGLVRGKGAAINCDGTSPIISNNVFVNNKSLSPEDWYPNIATKFQMMVVRFMRRTVPI